MAGLAQVERRSPHPVFSELHILKDFKCCVLKLPHSKRVIGGFCGTAHSKEVRLFRSGWNSRVGVNVGFNTEGAEFTERRSRSGKRSQPADAWKFVELDGERSTGYGSRSVGLLSTHLL